MDQFPKFIMAVNKLRDITPKTEQQVRLVGNVLQVRTSQFSINLGKQASYLFIDDTGIVTE